MYTTKYITPDDFKMFWGEDLNYILRDGQNVSNKAEAFLNRVDLLVKTFVNTEYYKNIDVEYHRFNDFQKQCYKYALLYQAQYMIKNGDISMDSGYDPENKIIANRNDLKNITLCQNTINQLQLCGVLTRKINTGRGWLWDVYWWS